MSNFVFFLERGAWSVERYFFSLVSAIPGVFRTRRTMLWEVLLAVLGALVIFGALPVLVIEVAKLTDAQVTQSTHQDTLPFNHRSEALRAGHRRKIVILRSHYDD